MIIRKDLEIEVTDEQKEFYYNKFKKSNNEMVENNEYETTLITINNGAIKSFYTPGKISDKTQHLDYSVTLNKFKFKCCQRNINFSSKDCLQMMWCMGECKGLFHYKCIFPEFKEGMDQIFRLLTEGNPK